MKVLAVLFVLCSCRPELIVIEDIERYKAPPNELDNCQMVEHYIDDEGTYQSVCWD